MDPSCAFRNPLYNDDLLYSAWDSWHQYGYAADIYTADYDEDGDIDIYDWEILKMSAKNNGACVEPHDLTGSNYVHMDWRPEICPQGW